MKKIIIITLAFCCTLVAGCDFVRTIAGRPTAAEVEAIRQEQVRKEEERHKARLDSMKRAQQQMADSLAALEAYLLDSLSQSKGKFKRSSNLGGIERSELECQYYVVVGAFRNIANARRKQSACYDAGYPAQIVHFHNGLNAVAVCPSDSVTELMDQFKVLKKSKVCPPDAWMLDARK